MLFSEVYGTYFDVLSEILEKAVDGKLTRDTMYAIIQEKGFEESILTIPQNLNNQVWPLLNSDLNTPLSHKPTQPITTLQKRWMKALLNDPRIRLFAPPVEGLEDVEPLYPADTFVYFDRYGDGDPFEVPQYIQRFQTILTALRERKWLRLQFLGRNNVPHSWRCIPYKLEYSPKDDKFRLITGNNRAPLIINLARITDCKLLEPVTREEYRPKAMRKRKLILELTDERNALERCMLHFSHLEKETERIDDRHYRLTLYYEKDDETELLIRVLSFGHVLKVISPDQFKEKLKTTHSDCLDLFATIGALRSAEKQEIISRFQEAFAENPNLAMKTLFFARDVRGGLGERKVFRVAMKWLAENAPASVRKNLLYIAEYGRWDDLLALMGTACEKDALNLIKDQLNKDYMAMDMGDEVSLLAKWLPSVNASNAETVRMAKRIARFLGMDDATYRKMLVKLRERIRIIENNLREKDYSFDYSKQPSKAMYKYRKAFMRNDGDRYGDFMRKVSKGEAKLNVGTLTPYDIIAPFFEGKVGGSERKAIDVTWNSQTDFAGSENALVVIDGSGSMYSALQPRPAAVALSLGIYFAERNTGAFKNHFITFSEKPQLVEIKGKDIYEKVNYCHKYNEVANTNIQKVFELILRAAVKNNVPQSEMPATLYIISDMEFDYCTKGADLTNFEYAKKIFSEAGYQLPRVVFWNVASRTKQQPVTMNEQGVALVSGCSPRIFGTLSSGNLSPMGYMLDILGTERYAKIAA